MKSGDRIPCEVCGKILMWAETEDGQGVALDMEAPTYRWMGKFFQKTKHSLVAHVATCQAPVVKEDEEQQGFY